jgi:hypothetical protein
VVAAAAALLYAIGWGVVEGAKQHRVEYQVIAGFENPQCGLVIQMPAGSKLSSEPKYDSPCWHLYLYRSIYEDAKQTKDGYIQHMNSQQNIVIAQTVVVALVLWLLGVAVAYGLGAVVAWVVTGFRSNEQPPNP